MDNTGKEIPPSYSPPEHAGYPASSPGYPQAGYPQAGYPQSGYGNTGYTGSNVTVIHQPAPATVTVVSTSVDSHLGLAVFACLCCFWPLGLVAIIMSSQVSSALAVNDLDRAQRTAATSRNLSIASIIIGVIAIIVILIVRLAVLNQ